MTAKEMFELAKAGYKPNEILEMHNITKQADPEPKEDTHVEPKEESKEEPKVEPKEEPKVEPKEEPTQKQAELEKLLAQTQKQLEELQKKNVNENLLGKEPSDDVILANLVRGFM